MSRPEGNTYYSYGCGSKLESAYSGGEGVDYTYDGNLLKSFSYSGTLSQTIAFEYDNFFRAKSISYAGLTENSAYDADGLLIKSGEFTINRDNSNGQAFLVSDGGLNLSRNFNNYGELDQETYNVNDISYSYKVLERTPSGKIKTKVEQLGNGSVIYNYDYDQRGRLTEVKQDNEIVETYVYDANGNRIAMDNKLTNENTKAYYRIDDTIEQFGKDSYHYNVDGYLETKTNQSGTSRYSYGSLGELKEVTLANGDIISYQHNVNNQRVAKLKNGEIVEKYLWLDLTTLLATYDKDNNLKQRYNYADGRMPVSYTDNGNTYYITYNQVGSPRAIMDEDGNIIKAITYDSFGNIITDTNPSMKIAFGFAGGLYDVDTKLNRFGYRDYDAHSGKWTSKDPIGLAGGDSNVLAYVGGDPVNYIDPDGKITKAIGLTVLAYIFRKSLIEGIKRAAIFAASLLAIEEVEEILEKGDSGEGEEETSAGCKSKNGLDYSDHGKQRKEEGLTDQHRNVDANNVIENGKKLIDNETGYDVYIKGDKVVILRPDGKVHSQFKNPKGNTQKRLQNGKWSYPDPFKNL